MKPDEPSYTGLCFDFKNILSYAIVPFLEMKWKRVCRLDSPFVDVMLQKFGMNSSRIGEPNINKRFADLPKTSVSVQEPAPQQPTQPVDLGGPAPGGN